jgi:DNA-binding HxlR family transcriptional regulator
MPVKRACEYERCPVEAALDLIGGRWKAMILSLLLDRHPLRFGELRRKLRGVTHRVLTAQLRDLEQTGLVSRRVHAEVPPRVEYTPTELALTLRPLLAELRRWGAEYALAVRRDAAAPGASSSGASGE